MAQTDLFDVENHSLTHEALKQALFATKPYAHSLSDTDIFGISSKTGIGIDEIVSIVQDARCAEEYLIDAALTQRDSRFANTEFRLKDNSGATAKEFLDSVIKRLTEDYAHLLPSDSVHSGADIIAKIIQKAYKWCDKKKGISPEWKKG